LADFALELRRKRAVIYTDIDIAFLYWQASRRIYASKRFLVLGFRILKMRSTTTTALAQMYARQCATIRFMTSSADIRFFAILVLGSLFLSACATAPNPDQPSPLKIATAVAPIVPKAPNAPSAPAVATGHAVTPNVIAGQLRPPAVPEVMRDRTSEVTVYALSLVGVKYKFGGNSAATGFDCSGFVNHVFGEIADYALPRNAEAIAQRGIVIDKNDLQAGDLVFYNTRSRANSHVGIYLGNNTFVHSPSRGKSVEIVDMTENYWQKRFNGARRLLSGSQLASQITTASKAQPAKPVVSRAAAMAKQPDGMPITDGQ
jgi:cell wall-associated NlpC family hydrolase